MFQEMTNVSEKNQAQNSNIHELQELTFFYYDKNLESKTNQMIKETF